MNTRTTTSTGTAADATAAEVEDALFDKVREHLETMITWARDTEALGMEHAPFEEWTLTQGFEIMRLFTEAHLAVRTAREEPREDVVDAQGRTRITTETGQACTRTMLYGPVVTRRMSYRRHHQDNLYPQDAELNWASDHFYSAGVTKRISRTVAALPFGQAIDQIEATTAIKLGQRQAQMLTLNTARDFEAFYAQRRPSARPAEVGLLITADGSAFPVLPGALRPATAKAAATRAAAQTGWPQDPTDLRKSTKRTAELVCVADIPPAPRTEQDILAALFPQARRAGPPDTPGPVAEGKTLFASAKHPIAQVIADGFAEAHRRDPDHHRPWYALVDGNNTQIEAINAQALEHGVQVPILIDLIHVIGYLWKAAATFFYSGDASARDWVREQTGKILQGRSADVVTGIRRRATRFGYSATERAGADSCATYLANKKDYLDYPVFLAAGRPVATGLIEGACRWLIKDRMEVTGARWGLDNAEAVLKLRALVGNDDFDEYFTYHLTQEKRRNHDARYQRSPS